VTVDALISGLVGFLVGTATGAAGKYFADKYTDQRKEKEAAARLRRQFLAELKADLGRADSSLIREFVILSNERAIFNSAMPRFAYYEERIPQLRNKAALLLAADFVADVSATDTPIFRMDDSFVRMVLKS
jgi:hypothetical protein